MVLGLSLAFLAHADGAAPLPPVDKLLTTGYDKSVISGSIAKDGYNFATDASGNLMFNYSGTVYSVETNRRNGRLTELESAVGSVQGQASFPMDFASLAIGMKQYLTGAITTLPAIPAVIPWTCNHCNLVIGDSTYMSIADATSMFDAASIEAMRMKGRAFTGIGPVEVGQLSAQSMSVRMAGCSAVVGIAGSDAGKLGTLCLNGTFTFDLAGINLSDMGASEIKGTGTSNCTIVMHKPLAM